MPTCPSGHESADYDYCDICGITIGGDAIPVVCPRCGVPRAAQFCEVCGYDFPGPGPGAGPGPGLDPLPAARGEPSARAAWAAVVTADLGYYERVRAAGGPDADAISFPVYCPQRRFPLSGTEVRVGRRSAHSGIDPEIDLAVPPADPGVSRLHAVLIRAADGGWSVVDPGSANGTLVNGTEIGRDELVPLRDGDRVNLGAWTELKIVREE
jgi:hypothetical protein